MVICSCLSDMIFVHCIFKYNNSPNDDGHALVYFPDDSRLVEILIMNCGEAIYLFTLNVLGSNSCWCFMFYYVILAF
jgi:hypothetical protein